MRQSSVDNAASQSDTVAGPICLVVNDACQLGVSDARTETPSVAKTAQLFFESEQDDRQPE